MGEWENEAVKPVHTWVGFVSIHYMTSMHRRGNSLGWRLLRISISHPTMTSLITLARSSMLYN